jgi:acetyl-CoA carboxylase carboxyl transferase subunit alpha
VISPEGCASILWKSAEKASEAAEALGITSGRLYELGLVDSVIPEPLGGAHRDVDVMAATIKQSLSKSLDALANKSPDDLVEARYKRLMSYGQFTDN